jgi:hypothetical protein
MSAMLTALSSGVGAFAGGFVGVRTSNRPSRRRRSSETDSPEEEFPEAEARQAARFWSRSAGRPEMEGVIAEKLRVGWTVQQRNRRKRSDW